MGHPGRLVGALLGWAVRWIGLSLRPLVHRNRVPVTVGLGLLIGLTAMAYQLITGNGFTDVLFSGQDALPALVANAADYSVATLVVLGVCKLLAYGLSLSAFRGGPVFPAMFVGAVLGIAISGLPGMSLAPAIGMGIGAMCCAMLRLPADLGAARDPPARQRRAADHARGHRGRRRGVRRHHDPADARAAAAGRARPAHRTGHDGGCRRRTRLTTAPSGRVGRRSPGRPPVTRSG